MKLRADSRRPPLAPTPSLNLVLKNLTSELLEYRVEHLEVEFGGVRGATKAISTGGFSYAGGSSKYLIDPVGEVEMSDGLIKGSVDYRIAYWPADNPKDRHQTSQSALLELYYETMQAISKTKTQEES